MPVYLTVAIAVAALLIVVVIVILLKLYGYVVRSRADRRAAATRVQQEKDWAAVVAKSKTSSNRP